TAGRPGLPLGRIGPSHGARSWPGKTPGGPTDRARPPPRRIAPAAGAAAAGFAIWTHVAHSDTFFLNPVELLAILAALAAVWLVYEGQDGFAFAATTVTMASCIVAIFAGLYPNVMVSSTNAAYNLTVHNTASNGYALKAMTVVVIVFLPFVLAYQSWTYYVFRRRISKEEFAAPSSAAGEAGGARSTAAREAG